MGREVWAPKDPWEPCRHVGGHMLAASHQVSGSLSCHPWVLSSGKGSGCTRCHPLRGVESVGVAVVHGDPTLPLFI